MITRIDFLCGTRPVCSGHAACQGSLHVHFKSTWADRHGVHYRPMDKCEIDIVCIYCPETDSCSYFRPGDFNRGVRLRVEPAKNNQAKRVHMAAEYTTLNW